MALPGRWCLGYRTKIKRIGLEGKVIINGDHIREKGVVESGKITTDASGNLSVEFTSKDEEFSFEFSNSKEGLVLKK
jgi:hypothetical protein